MDAATALAIFGELEPLRYEDDGPETRMYEVKLVVSPPAEDGTTEGMLVEIEAASITEAIAEAEREHPGCRGRSANPVEDADPQPWAPPLYDIRLDAKSDREDNREVRLRIAGNYSEAADWRRVIDIAEHHEVRFRLENAAVELY